MLCFGFGHSCSQRWRAGNVDPYVRDQVRYLITSRILRVLRDLWPYLLSNQSVTGELASQLSGDPGNPNDRNEIQEDRNLGDWPSGILCPSLSFAVRSPTCRVSHCLGLAAVCCCEPPAQWLCCGKHTPGTTRPNPLPTTNILSVLRTHAHTHIHTHTTYIHPDHMRAHACMHTEESAHTYLPGTYTCQHLVLLDLRPGFYHLN